MSLMSESQLEDVEFALSEEFRKYSIDQLHRELESTDDLRRSLAAIELHIRGSSETFTIAKSLSKRSDSAFREVAAFVLGQLGTPNRPFREQSEPILSHLLQNDSSSKVRAAAAAALGHLESIERLELLKNAAVDSSPDVRANVAFALGKIKQQSSIPQLINLTKDEDINVISWAVIGLRMLNVDAPVIRNRFVELLNSAREDTLGEVIGALAEWRDVRVFSSLLNELNKSEIYFDVLIAAGELGDVRLLPRLKALREEWVDDPPEALLDAIRKIEGKPGSGGAAGSGT